MSQLRRTDCVYRIRMYTPVTGTCYKQLGWRIFHQTMHPCGLGCGCEKKIQTLLVLVVGGRAPKFPARSHLESNCTYEVGNPRKSKNVKHIPVISCGPPSNPIQIYTAYTFTYYSQHPPQSLPQPGQSRVEFSQSVRMISKPSGCATTLAMKNMKMREMDSEWLR